MSNSIYDESMSKHGAMKATVFVTSAVNTYPWHCSVRNGNPQKNGKNGFHGTYPTTK
jgi:hypothetical protein